MVRTTQKIIGQNCQARQLTRGSLPLDLLAHCRASYTSTSSSCCSSSGR